MSIVDKQANGCCCVGECFGFRLNWLEIETVDAVAIVGDDEQAIGGACAPVVTGKIMLETLRILGLALRGPRSCCTAR